ncbi:fimbrial protein [Cedecea sp. FDAARGOS_727]|uniref:fimbrial protein n=1 Tax=Cedecea sp. FDAARGOS_727 TaxID=2545798 RepID=UPI00143E4C90|nr:fimbrial protein [Cedecea sp. FDAARGOS_727]QIX94989.1 fimbrial protein [Cedecea sp. FDAARGOS_727]
MKRKNLALALTTLLCTSSVFAAPVESPDSATVKGGTIKFVGSLVNAACALEQPAGGQVVDLQQFSVAELNKSVGAVTQAKDFEIKLTDCSVETYKKASVKFSGVSVPGKNTILALGNDHGISTASGVGIQILSDGQVVTVDGSTPSGETVLQPGNTRMRFQAQYISTSTDVKPGAANASAEFSITYS